MAHSILPELLSSKSSFKSTEISKNVTLTFLLPKSKHVTSFCKNNWQNTIQRNNVFRLAICSPLIRSFSTKSSEEETKTNNDSERTKGMDAEMPIEILEQIVKNSEQSFGLNHQFSATSHLKLAQNYLRMGVDPQKVLYSANIAWKANVSL